MTETRFPASVPSPERSSRAGSGEPNARIINIPDKVRAELQTRKAALRLRGEVVRHNDDGSIRVRTERGDVDVRLREGQAKPERGTSVEVEIPPAKADGRAPEAANVRELPRENPARPAPPVEHRTSATPVEIEVRPQQGEASAPRQTLPAEERHGANVRERAAAYSSSSQTLPPEGSVVRLQPLPPRVAASYPAQDILPQVVQSVIAPVVFEAQIIAAQVQSETQHAIVSDVKPVVRETPAPLTQILSTPIVIPDASASAVSSSVPLPPNAGQEIAPVIITQPVAFATLETPTLQTRQPLPIPVEASTILKVSPRAVQDVLSSVIPLPELPVPASISALPQTSSLNVLAEPEAAPQHAPVIIKPQVLDVVIEKVTPPGPEFLSGSRDVPAPGIKPVDVTKPEQLIVQNQNAGSLLGVVTAVTQSALPVVSVYFPQLDAEQIFALQFPSDAVSIGTHIQVRPQVTPILQGDAAQMSAAQPLPLAAFFNPQPWPALDEALQVLARSVPQTAQAMVNVTPSPANPAQLGPAVMFFVAALRGGDMASWLGEKASEILKSEKGGRILARLLGDGANLSRMAAEPMAQDWRAVNIPLYHEGDMHKIGLYYRHEHENGEQDDKALKGTRFVFDLALDVMGKVQLDGLFRPVSESGKRLDLLVRTEQHFSEATRGEMRRIYARALRDSGVSGELSFQGSPEGWVTISTETSSAFATNI